MKGKEYPIEIEPIGHECALVGIVLKEPTTDIWGLTGCGLDALQNRGEEAAGVGGYTGTQFILEKDLGLRSVALPYQLLSTLPPAGSAIGHTRYSTTGCPEKKNAQPYLFTDFLVAHNGNITILPPIEIVDNEPTSDSFKAGKAIALQPGRDFVERVINVLRQLNGSYVFLFLAKDGLLVASDPWQVRPCLAGKLREDSGYTGMVVASESTGLVKIGAEFLKVIPRGSLSLVRYDGIETLWTDPRANTYPPARCSFEKAYFANAPSMAEPEIHGKLTNHSLRIELGQHLAEIVKPEGEIVVPVPRSGTSYAQGVCLATGKPFTEAIHVNSYKGRTFIKPYLSDQRLQAAFEKYYFIPELIKGKKITLVEDSIVRGNTAGSLILALFSLGAEQIELLVGIPPIKDNCYLGIDFQDPQELIYNQLKAESTADFEKKLADRLINGDAALKDRLRVRFQRLEDYVAIVSRVSPATPINESGGCYHCVSGINPQGIIFDRSARKDRFDANQSGNLRNFN